MNNLINCLLILTLASTGKHIKINPEDIAQTFMGGACLGTWIELKDAARTTLCVREVVYKSCRYVVEEYRK